jgi:hypothetical protein
MFEYFQIASSLCVTFLSFIFYCGLFLWSIFQVVIPWDNTLDVTILVMLLIKRIWCKLQDNHIVKLQINKP